MDDEKKRENMFADLPRNPNVARSTTKRENMFSDLPSPIKPAKNGFANQVADQFGRQMGMTARHAIAGPSKAAAGLVDAGSMAVNQLGEYAGIDGKIPMLTPGVDQVLDRAGFPSPQNPQERIAAMGSEGIAAAAAPIGLAQNTALAAQPLAQGVSGALSGIASQGAQEAGLPPWAQNVAGIAGSMLPGARTTGRVAGENIARMRGVDASPQGPIPMSAGDATQNSAMQRIEDLTSGTDRMRRFRESQEETAGNLMRPEKNDPTAAGKLISNKIDGKGGYIERFKNNASKRYDKVDELFDPELPIEMRNTYNFLSTPTALAENAPSTAKVLGSRWLQDMGVALHDDLVTLIDNTGHIGMPYKAVKEMRTAIGERLASPSLVDDVSTGQLKRVYAALSEDLEIGAGEWAGPAGKKAAKEANDFYREGMEKITQINRVVGKEGGFDEIYKRAFAQTKDSPERLNYIFGALPPSARKEIADMFVFRLGKPPSGAASQEFSMRQFTNNWGKMDAGTREVLANAIGPGSKEALDHIINVTERVASGKGRPDNALTWFISKGPSEAIAKYLTNPRTIQAMAKGSDLPVSEASLWLQELAQMAGNEE